MARILIVDDSFTARTIMKRLIGGAHDLAEASSGETALAALKATPFDLVLLDLLMPEMDGFETLCRAKSIRPRTPVLIVSADIQETTRERVLESGAAGIVHKPLKKDAILSAIASALERT
jgi:twitching motility two-component system response regulator PilH